ncbi:hypothetical protein ACIOEW_20195 [Streptomyces sp. NPDC087901]|uniref:hypothetical protein n=1 Tax=Streptomyces sp. NPDC087901 TaxID=3365818 RepID=UPI00380E5931
MTEKDADGGPWAALSEGSRPSEHTAQAWLRGLGSNRAAPAEVLVGLFDTGKTPSVYFLYRDDLPAGVLDAAAVHPARNIRISAAESGRLSPAQWSRLLAATAGSALRDALAELAAEQAPGARVGIEQAPDPASRPPSSPAEIAAMAAAVPDITADDRTYALWWVAALHSDADAMRRLVVSPNLRIRRSVARAPHLPPDVVDVLAHDEDRIVRLFLTESCEDAPADLLLEVWSWWPGSFSFPGRPRNHPNFPRHGLLRFAEDPDPRFRLLALDDPASSAALAERFSRDPDAQVRGSAAGDLRLSPESAVVLTGDDDPDVRRSAWRSPVLPPDVLVSLLLDEQSAEDAARNTAIPTAVMHRMIALATACPPR